MKKCRRQDNEEKANGENLQRIRYIQLDWELEEPTKERAMMVFSPAAMAEESQLLDGSSIAAKEGDDQGRLAEINNCLMYSRYPRACGFTQAGLEDVATMVQ